MTWVCCVAARYHLRLCLPAVRDLKQYEIGHVSSLECECDHLRLSPCVNLMSWITICTNIDFSVYMQSAVGGGGLIVCMSAVRPCERRFQLLGALLTQYHIALGCRWRRSTTLGRRHRGA